MSCQYLCRQCTLPPLYLFLYIPSYKLFDSQSHTDRCQLRQPFFIERGRFCVEAKPALNIFFVLINVNILVFSILCIFIGKHFLTLYIFMKFGMKVQSYVKVKTVFNFLTNMAAIYFKMVQQYAIFNRTRETGDPIKF